MTSQSQTITIIDTIHVAPSQVYRAFTDAETWCEWCVEEAQTNPRPGGKLHIYTDGYHAYGEFRELEPDTVVEFTWNGDNEPPTLIRVSLEEEKGSTNMNFQVTGLGTDKAWNEIAGELEKIWARALRYLKTVLETELEK
jgi:uncharacterized protein YndB with AHSA1/START domain